MSQPNQKVAPTREAPDPLVDEVRKIRSKISDRFGNDVDRLLDHLKEVEKRHTGPTICPEGDLGQPISSSG